MKYCIIHLKLHEKTHITMQTSSLDSVWISVTMYYLKFSLGYILTAITQALPETSLSSSNSSFT